MAYDDLRSFLRALDEAGQLLHIADEVMPEPDIAAAANAVCRLGDAAPGLYFDNVAGFADARIAMNVHGSWANHALALGMDKSSAIKDQVGEFMRRWTKFPVKPEWRADPLWAQNQLQGAEANVFDVLPLFRLNDGDGGFYIDKAAVVSEDPDDPENSAKQNVGIYRIQVKGPRTLALQAAPMHDIAQHLRKAEERGEDLPVAIAIGNDPVISIVASTPMAYDENEFELAGALREAPAPIAKAPVTGLPAPWGSEVVIDGVIQCRKREIEGPFGEFTGHYTGGRKTPVIRVEAISYRTNPIFEQLYLGMPWTELDYLLAANTCVPLYKQLKREFPEVQAVNAMYTHGLVAIVSTHKRYGGFAKAVGVRVLTTAHGLGYAATVIVVDGDVDPFNLPQVMWSLSTKMIPSRDLIVIPNLSVMGLAPQADPAGIVDKLIIDATTPTEPECRGNYSNQVNDLPEVDAWLTTLQALAGRNPPPTSAREMTGRARRECNPSTGVGQVIRDWPGIANAGRMGEGGFESVEAIMCPRCADEAIEKLSTSPLPGRWDVLQCARCLYSWRTTEPARRSRREAYPATFKMTIEDIRDAPEVPNIPPLRAQY
ncbi:non-oxidative hydroxyarylic acid decarboxylases subunit C [Mycobacterium heidelbergense]|uniref:non-oxidative hydroxyarylic acid decarboxylases subunit C n=1 Tax=Mycobacterium heidelbergense TaxID=53376 RepID=UPI003CED34A3